MAKRISHNNVGETFTIFFTEQKKSLKYQLSGFYGVQNALESCTAYFIRASLNPGEYGTSFQATRKNGRWVCGDEIIRSI